MVRKLWTFLTFCDIFLLGRFPYYDSISFVGFFDMTFMELQLVWSTSYSIWNAILESNMTFYRFFLTVPSSVETFYWFAISFPMSCLPLLWGNCFYQKILKIAKTIGVPWFKWTKVQLINNSNKCPLDLMSCPLI